MSFRPAVSYFITSTDVGFIRACCLVTVLIALSAPAAVAADAAHADARRHVAPAVDDTQIHSWIQQLGDDSFAVREAASQKLIALGGAARKHLRNAATDPHPEVRSRAERLLVLLEQGRFEERLEAFAADLEGTQGLTMPGWNEFQQVVGADTAARALFVEMQRHEAGLMRMAFADDHTEVEKQLAERLERLNPRSQLLGHLHDQRGMSVPPLGSCAAVLFIAATSKSEHNDHVSQALAQLAQQDPLRVAIQGGNFQPQVRRLLAHWILHREANNQMLLPQKLSLAATYQLKEVLPLAVAAAHGRPPWESIPANIRGIAVLVAGRLAEDQVVEHLETLLEDDTECTQWSGASRQIVPGRGVPDPQPRSVQIRDVALAVMVQQTGQELAAYGIQAEPHEPTVLKLATAGFASDTDRSVALAKWRQWRSGNGKQAAEVRGERVPES